MQVLRGRYNGQAIELLEGAAMEPNTHVLVLVLEGELERAAARVDRQTGVRVGAEEMAPDDVPHEVRGERPSTVGEIMTEQVVTVNPRMAVIDAMHLMARQGITSVIVEPGAAGDWGIMTMRDVLDRIVRANRSSEHVAVGELASRPLLTAARDMSLQACSELMVNHRVRRVVVQEGGQPVGIVSETDIFRVVEQYGWEG